MQTLHLTGAYLPLRMNWMRRVIRQAPGRPYVAGLEYCDEGLFDPDISHWPNPRYRAPWRWADQLASGRWGIGLRRLGVFRSSILGYIRREKIDLLHIHFGNLGADYFPLGLQAGVPVVVSFYGNDYGRALQRRRYRKLYPRMFAAVEALLVEGPYGAWALEQLGCPARKIHIAPLGLPVGSIPWQIRDKAAGRLKLVQVAGFREKKGQLDSLEAVAMALGDCPGLRLDLVGELTDNTVLQRVRRRIRELGLEASVRLLPPVPYAQLHRFLLDYDAFIQPSRFTLDGDCEGGAPVALLDAQASGMPVIATRHCDIPAVVADPPQLVAERDIRGLAEQIRLYYAMGRGDYARHCCAARQFVADHYQLHHLRNALRRAYPPQENHSILSRCDY